MIKTVRVSDKGQIAIPKVLREELGIYKGDELVLINDNGKLLIEKSEKVSERIKDDFADIVALTSKSLEDVWDNKEDDVWSEYLKDEN
jgi:AbrB family looped-hinge helix DNA binding protein